MALALLALLTSCQEDAAYPPAAVRVPNVTAAPPPAADGPATAADGQTGDAASPQIDTNDLDLDNLDLENLDLDDLDLEDLELIGMKSVEANPLGGCGTCHTDVEDEMAGTVHLREEIGCIECHGPSDGHIRDENNEVKPDQVFARADVDRLCDECHRCSRRQKVAGTFCLKGPSGASHKRCLSPFSSPAAEAPAEHRVCTDCHQPHSLDPVAE